MGRKGDMDSRVSAWWDAVIAGEADEAHPIHGENLSARVKNGRLELSGRLARPNDRNELVMQARSRIGHGIREVDDTHLRVADHRERRGVLEQTLVAAFPDRGTATLARKVVLERSRITPLLETIVDHDHAANLRDLVPAEFVDDLKKRIERGEALLVLRVDETDAFTMRALLEEETRSTWTIATPPAVNARG
jgi:hypothetical protein